jgi:hypothetical protein
MYDNGGTLCQKFSAACYNDSRKYDVLQYLRLKKMFSQAKFFLAEGYTFDLGFTVYEGFYNITAGGMMLLGASDERVVGRQAVMAVGYKEPKQFFIIRNS